MLASEFITRVSHALQGDDDDPPIFGTEKATYWLSVFNRLKDQLHRNSRLRLSSAFQGSTPNEPGTVETTGTTTLTGTNTYFTDYRAGDQITVDGETVRTIDAIASDTSLTVTVAFSNTASSKTFTRSIVIDDGVQTYNLHRSFAYPSDKAYVTLTTGDIVEFDLIKPQERNSLNQRVYISGLNPVSISFSDTISSTSNLVGGVLSVPGFYIPADVSLATDEIPLSNPDWGVLATAAEIAFNDVVYEDKAPDLNAKANEEYSSMVSLNRAGTFSNPRKTPYSNYRIGQRLKR